MVDVVVRRATTDDVAELAEMRRAFTYEDPSPGDERTDFEAAFDAVIVDGLRDGSWVVWLGESAGEIVAHAFVALVHKVPRPIEAAPLLGYLTNVYTRPSHRGQGLGGRMLDEVTGWAEASGIELLIVWPSEESIDFYRRHGFASSDEPLVWTIRSLSDRPAEQRRAGASRPLRGGSGKGNRV